MYHLCIMYVCPVLENFTFVPPEFLVDLYYSVIVKSHGIYLFFPISQSIYYSVIVRSRGILTIELSLNSALMKSCSGYEHNLETKQKLHHIKCNYQQ